MAKQYGPWVIHESEEMYCDPWMRVQRDQVTRPDGQPGTYATVDIKAGVCVIAIDNQQNVQLTKEFHYAVGRETLEGVSGGIEAGEGVLETAQRELAEELGLQAESWTHLGTVDPFTAGVLSPVDLFLAQDLNACPTNPDATELIEHVVMPLKDTIEAIRASEITHAPTCVALLRIALDFS